MKTKILTIIILAFSLQAFATDVIVRQSNGQSYFFYDTAGVQDETILQAAINACSNGDTLYLPGVEYDFNTSGNLLVDRSIVIIGTGINPDSNSIGTDITRMNDSGGRIYINSGADGVEFHGIYFDINIYVGNSPSNSDVSGILFSRCYIYSFYAGPFSGTNSARNIEIRECFIENIGAGDDAVNVIIANNVIRSNNYGSATTQYINNVFLNTSLSQTTYNDASTLYKGNLFIMPTSVYVQAPGQFVDNAFVLTTGSLTYDVSRVSGWSNNQQFNIGVTDLFQDANVWSVGINPINTINIRGNYLLDPTGSQYATLSTMAAGNTTVGIEGGFYPWKLGSLPFNPHWINLSVPTQTTTGGQLLNISVSGSAQER